MYSIRQIPFISIHMISFFIISQTIYQKVYNIMLFLYLKRQTKALWYKKENIIL